MRNIKSTNIDDKGNILNKAKTFCITIFNFLNNIIQTTIFLIHKFIPVNITCIFFICFINFKLMTIGILISFLYALIWIIILYIIKHYKFKHIYSSLLHLIAISLSYKFIVKHAEIIILSAMTIFYIYIMIILHFVISFIISIFLWILLIITILICLYIIILKVSNLLTEYM